MEIERKFALKKRLTFTEKLPFSLNKRKERRNYQTKEFN